MTSPLWGKYCDDGHYCSAPKECCTLGCCYHTLPTNGVFSLWFLGHWYFWALVLAAILALLCACSLWRRCWRALRFRSGCACCGPECGGLSTGRDERASEPDSTGSCYAPPHYSRCNSFHHAPPPPYAEVTSKPDLYPLVISYNGDTGMKRGGSASYLMVQYFRNYILRPSGSISATSTIDSLSSSFICNAANEANTVIPPPYSCTGSLEGFTFTANPTSVTENQMVQSASSCNEFQPQQIATSSANESPQTQHYSAQNSPKYKNSKPNSSVSYSPVYVHNKTTSFINNMPNGRVDLNETILRRCYIGQKPKKIVSGDNNSMDSETSQGEENNFSELLNLSVCAPSSLINSLAEAEFDVREPPNEQHNYSIANSVTVSDISSLANLGTPDSPPRATSPTLEIRELLDKIQQLPQQKSPAPDPPPKTNRFCVKNKSKTLYMPLSSSNKQKLSPGHSKNSIFAGTSGIFSSKKSTKAWLSRSAPATPCGNFAPLFPSQRKSGKNIMPKSHMGSKSKMDDASALLTEFDGSDDDQHNGNVRL